ncbi:hypothetical protein H0A36_00935 [Endozoicomonas sp. SM1973]|uniref:VWFA domain-containing protein n=1 Tax=Spartinivicinus marinus TaxID=2994442 RepID=A0A853I3L9_9GAMM|nr:PilC/PilY family type IV pilus protein [Spartinivicinus marinus]MCX4026717.1 PilC/PilY family type IV pilus protein [Spartinivicinus marinus]NYZ64551.1 hypothetical protein [Spartinivicinus marinus]
MKSTNFKLHYLALSVSLVTTSLSVADDTEIFFNKNDNNKIRSNVLLLLDTSGSMRDPTIVPPYADYKKKFKIDNGTNPHRPQYNSKKRDYTLTRLEVIQDVAANLVEITSGINISLARFDAKEKGYLKGSEGGFINLAAEEVSKAKLAFQEKVNKYKPAGWTPLSESMHEMLQYFSGSSLVYGNNSIPDKSTPNSKSGNQYISPIKHQCQYNNLIVFTDGKPTKDTSSNAKTRSLISSRSLPNGLYKNCGYNSNELPKGNDASGRCMDELAWYMKNTDMADQIDGKQTVSTYTIGGFGLGGDAVELLKSTARHGGGKYYSADNVEGLQKALDDIISRVLDINTTFVTPAVTIDSFNRLQNSDEIYYTLFRPDKGPRWSGNLKRFKLNDNNDVVDVNGKKALNNGGFSKDSQSYWSTEKDGADILKGGMISQLGLNRNIYTYTDSNPPKNVLLTTSANEFHENNNSLTLELMGETDSDSRKSSIQWGRGVDIYDLDQDGKKDDINQRIGDPLHTTPKVINYYSNANSQTKDTTVFFTTNEGFLHAIDAATGKEEFSFIPQELLPNITAYRRNEAKDNQKKLYGLDGPIEVWHLDKNNDKDLLISNNGSADTGEHLYLYLTMRRGGNNIYALNVTNRQSPILEWVIKGDLDKDGKADETGDFRELGQTWSKPTIAKIKWKGADELKTVLFFTAGYDPSQDEKTTMAPDQIGRAIYVVDPETGEKLWEASAQASANEKLTEMKYSFPANLSLVDINSNGAVDYFYAVDISGQVWRFDINQKNSGSNNFAKGHLLAKLGEPTGTSIRRFYSAADPSLVQKRGSNNSYIALSVGSGFRAHPLDKTNADRFYMVKDYRPFGPIISGSLVTVTEGDLYDATENLIQDGIDDNAKQQARAELNAAKGWFIRLEHEGEKVLGESTTYAGVLLFTTHQPTTAKQSSDPCKPSAGTGLLYAVNLQDATAVVPSGNSNEPNKKKRHFILKNGGIPGTPGVIQREGDPVVAVGTEINTDALEERDTLYKTFWREE